MTAVELNVRALALLDECGIEPFADLGDQLAAWRMSADVFDRLAVLPELGQRLFGFDALRDGGLPPGTLELVGWAPQDPAVLTLSTDPDGRRRFRVDYP